MVEFFLMGKFSRELTEIEVMEETVVQTVNTRTNQNQNVFIQGFQTDLQQLCVIAFLKVP